MRCEFCGREYDAAAARENCKKYCEKYGLCGMNSCPTCFYEMVIEPQWYGKVFSTSGTY